MFSGSIGNLVRKSKKKAGLEKRNDRFSYLF